MSLKGSLETVALPEVLQLLSDTSKSGELYVRGTRPGGRLWFEDGALCAFEVGRSDELAASLFELLRVESGEFSFHADAPAPPSAHRPASGREDIQPALRMAQARLEEWIEIVGVVPSLGHSVRLVGEAPRDEIVLDRSQWSLLVAIGEGHSVQDILTAANLPEFDGCKALKGLVDESLAEIGDPVSRAVPVGQEPVDRSSELEAPASFLRFGDPVVSQPVADSDEEPVAVEEPAVEAGAEDGDAPADQPGDLLSSDGRAAMQALLDELAPPVDKPVATGEPVDEAVATEEPVDGLSDRGPWTSNELEQMGEWHQETGDQVVAASDQPAAASEPAPAGLEEPGSAFHPGSGYDANTQEPAGHEPADLEGTGPNPTDQGQAVVESLGGQIRYEPAEFEPAAYESETEVEPEEDSTSEEPINRGLLLKFLSSVRN